MTAPSPATRLAAELNQRQAHLNCGYATKAGITTRQLANAICGRPVTANAYLRLAVALGFDPCPDLPHEPLAGPCDFDYPFFAMAFRIARGLKGHNDRQAAEAIEVSASTVCRIEAAQAVLIGVLIRACRYIGCHPWGYCHAKWNPPNTVEKTEKTISTIV